MYHIKFHFTTVNDDERAKNNQNVSSFPEETHYTDKVGSVSGMVPQFCPDGACLWGFRKCPQKVSCTVLGWILQCTTDGQPAPLIYNTHYWGLPSYKIRKFKKLHICDFYAWRLIPWFRTELQSGNSDSEPPDIYPSFLAIILPALVMTLESTCLEM